MPLAFSYIRFSSAKQELGDSLRRQTKLAEDYATKHGLILNTHSFQDLGVSAFEGKNAVDGGLAAFLEAVDKGIVPKGSFLLVESLDRISRAEVMDAMELFLSIIRRGITIVTLQDGQVFSKEKIREDRGISLIVSITVMMRAHEESATKQHRISKSWENKRTVAAAGGMKMSSVGPSWLTLSEDRKSWIVDREKAKVVQRIFELALSGVGTPTIARKFNEEKVPTMQRAAFWTFGTINAILKNASVTGMFTPKKAAAAPIPEYYPRIISDAQFYQVREHLLQRRWVPGTNSRRMLNLFSGICSCASCHSMMRVKSASASNNGKSYLQCLLAFSGKDCDQPIFPAYAAERAILSHLAHTVAVQIKNSENVNHVDPVKVLEHQRQLVKEKIEKLIDALTMTGNSERVAARIAKLEEELDELNGQIASTVDPRAVSAATVEALDIFKKLKRPDLLTADERQKVQFMLKRIIESVTFDGESLTVAVKYLPHIRRHVDFIDVTPFMDKVGGDRTGHKVARVRAAKANG
jgi:DNA invertase Pin-like site-specific DNA recombinase